jgi:hypothetical protein
VTGKERTWRCRRMATLSADSSPRSGAELANEACNSTADTQAQNRTTLRRDLVNLQNGLAPSAQALTAMQASAERLRIRYWPH